MWEICIVDFGHLGTSSKPPGGLPASQPLRASPQNLYSLSRVQDHVACVSLDALSPGPRPSTATSIPCKPGLETASIQLPAPSYLQCSSACSEPGTTVIPHATGKRRGDHSIRADLVQLRGRHPRAEREGQLIWTTEPCREALGWSARPAEGNGRAHTSTGGGRPPVTVGPARRLCKGRDWSFEIHRTGPLKTAAEKAPGRLGES
jgi:hypothetical protein